MSVKFLAIELARCCDAHFGSSSAKVVMVMSVSARYAAEAAEDKIVVATRRNERCRTMPSDR